MPIEGRVNREAFEAIQSTMEFIKREAGLPNTIFLKQLNFGLVQSLKGVVTKAKTIIKAEAKTPRNKRTGSHARSFRVSGLAALRNSKTGKYYRKFGARIRVTAPKLSVQERKKTRDVRLGSYLALEYGNEERKAISPIQKASRQITASEVRSLIIRNMDRRIAQRIKRTGQPQDANSIFRRSKRSR